MKSYKEIERMDFGELERISEDTGIKAPEGFVGRLENGLAGLAASAEVECGRKAGRRRKVAFSVAGTALAAVSLLVAVGRFSSPKDTFDDPLLAYAQVEKSFSLISEKMNKGAALASEVVPAMNKPKEIIDKINRK